MFTDTRNNKMRAAHDLVDPFLEYANGLPSGFCKHWKAVGILTMVAEMPEEFRGDDLVAYVKNCLGMEGFRGSDCEKIAAWIEENLHPVLDK